MLQNSFPLSKIKYRTLEISLGVALLAICAQITIPIGVIPITLQSAAVLFIGLFYDKVSGPITIMSYLTLGFCGAPIFMNSTFGIAKLTGPSAGYMIGFIFAVYVMASLKDKFLLNHKILNQISLGLIGNAIITGCGWLWLSKFFGFEQAFYTGVLPFIIPGIIKSILLIGLIRVVKPGLYKY